MMRVLIVGENASMRMGGEAAIPFLYFKFLRGRGIEAWLLTHERNREELSALLPDEVDRLHFIPELAQDMFLWRLTRWLPRKINEQSAGALMAMKSQVRLRRKAIDLVRSEGIDIVHQVYPVSPKAPSGMYGLGAPVVIGPMSGDMDYPPAFQYMHSPAARALERFGRRAADRLNRLLPGKLRADSLIASDPRTRRALPRGARGVVYEGVPDVSVNLETFQYDESAEAARRGDGPVRFLFLGRLVDWKGVDLLLEAFRRAVDGAGDREIRLEILGDGQERAALEARAHRLGLGDRVHFAGWVRNEETPAWMARAHVFVLPSLRECGGIVLLEAMAMGLPVIATRWGGPEIHVDDATGIRVEPSSREGFIAGLAEAMLRLARSPGLRAEMGAAGRERVRSGWYTWDRKVDRILEIYEETLERAGAPARR